MSDYVIMPKADYQNACDFIRTKSGKADLITSGQLKSEIEAIAGTGGSVEGVHFVTFMSEDGTEELYKRPVADGDDCADPVKRNLIAAPTKASTAQYNYDHAGWATEPNGALNDNALKAVTEDRTVYANFAAILRSYTISFYDSDGTTLLTTKPVPYGSVPSYTPTKDGYMLIGWTPTPVAVTGEASYTAQWTDDIAFATAPFSVLKSVLSSGQASTAWAVGDVRRVPLTLNSGSVMNVDFEIRHFDSDGKPYIISKTAFAFTLWCADGCSKIHYLNNDSSTNWGNCHVYSMYNSDVLAAFPAEMQEIIGFYTQTTSLALGGGTTSMYTSTVTGKAWIPSNDEMSSWYSSNGERIKYEQTASGVGATAIQYCTRDMRRAKYWRPGFVHTNGAVYTTGDDSPYTVKYAPVAVMLSAE